MEANVNRDQARVKNMLLVSMILVPLVPMILVLSIGYYYFTLSVEKSGAEDMKRVVTSHGQMIEQFLSERIADLELTLNTYSFKELGDQNRLERIFAILQRRSPAFADLGVFDGAGLHVAYQGPYSLTGLVYRDEAWFQKVMAKGTYVSDVFLGFRNVPHFIIAISRREEGRRWVIRATIDTHFFNSMVKNVRIGQTGEAYIINSKGVLQTDKRSGGKLMEISPDHHLALRDKPANKHFITRDKTGLKYIYLATPLKDGDWHLIVRREVDEAFAERRAASYLILVILAAGGFCIILTAVSLTGRIMKRLETAEQNRQRLTEQLVRATRLAELGQMAAGVAHEINNPLQIIRSEHALIKVNLAELKDVGSLEPSNELAEIEDSFSQIKKQVDRCAVITQSILKFGRQSKPCIQPVHLQPFIPEVLLMVAKRAEVHGIQVDRSIQSGLPPIRADAAQLEQVLLNLLNNAIDATVERHGVKGGLLKIEAKISGDNEVTISVTDNGCGISPDNLAKIFTPFFSTKSVGKGTGLGLAVCYGIIDSLGGSMEVSSRRNEGTTFLVHLPAAGTE